MEIGEIQQVTKPTFTVIGKAGEGLVEDSSSWVPNLWEHFNAHFSEVVEVVEEDDFEVHLWGLMSDEGEWLAPWQRIGKYLAGLEVPADTVTPDGWSKWQLPAQDYFVLMTDGANLDPMTEKVLTEILPEHRVELVGAIQEHYLPEFQDEVELYFPVAAINEVLEDTADDINEE